MVRCNPVGTAVGGLVLAALLLTGCGTDDDGAAASPSGAPPPASAASAAPTAAPGPDATPADYVPASLDGSAQNVPKPVMPDLAREESRAGAQAFLDYWSDAMWYAYQTGDTSYARDIISPHCEVCLNELSEVEQVYGGSQWLAGGRQKFELQDSAIQRAVDGIYKPVVKYRNDEVQLVGNQGVVDAVPPDPNSDEPLIVYIDYVDQEWIYITMAPLSRS
ncbi:DUF6318 family protein [Kocuria rhizosphaericola]|uniref:DUF6318 family protein n=1 Tax=Kocuria rhizosphaericola TaxID=3376284 RepID=UPI0037B5D6D5